MLLHQNLDAPVSPLNDVFVGYVAATPNITGYGPRGSHPLEQFDAPVNYYSEEAVAPDGTIALTTEQPDAIAIYYKGSHMGTTISVPSFPNGLAFDGSSNLYFSIGDTTAYVDEAANTGSGFGAPEVLLSGAWFGRIAIDPSGELVVEHVNAAANDYLYYVYPAGAATAKYGIGYNLTNWSFAIDKRAEFMYALYADQEGGSSIWIFRYPGGTPYAYYPLNYANTTTLAISPPAALGPPWSNARRHH